MGIIEIILTILVWRKGWKWYALIPITVAFIIGATCGLIGIHPINILWVDIFAAIALIVMFDKKPKNIEKDS